MSFLVRTFRGSRAAVAGPKRARIHSTSPSSNLASSAYVGVQAPSPATHETPSDLTRPQREGLEAALRVDQAGEVAANYIYMGQMAVLGSDPKVGGLIQVSPS
jgi:ubiquinone biosynthesis monooxygenase Coq7